MALERGERRFRRRTPNEVEDQLGRLTPEGGTQCRDVLVSVTGELNRDSPGGGDVLEGGGVTAGRDDPGSAAPEGVLHRHLTGNTGRAEHQDGPQRRRLLEPRSEWDLRSQPGVHAAGDRHRVGAWR